MRWGRRREVERDRRRRGCSREKKKEKREERRGRKGAEEEETVFLKLCPLPTIVDARLREALDFFFNCSISQRPLKLLLLSFLSFSTRESNKRTLKLSLGGIGASTAAAAGAAARGGMPDEVVLLCGAEEASGAAGALAAMLLLSAEATFLPAALAGEGCGEGERDGETGAAGSLAGQSGRIGEREARETVSSIPLLLGSREVKKIKGKSFEGEYDWTNIYKIIKVGNCIIIYKDRIIGNFIPINSFNSKEDYQLFWEYAKQNNVTVK